MRDSSGSREAALPYVPSDRRDLDQDLCSFMTTLYKTQSEGAKALVQKFDAQTALGSSPGS
jgi:hypothetical protein